MSAPVRPFPTPDRLTERLLVLGLEKDALGKPSSNCKVEVSSSSRKQIAIPLNTTLFSRGGGGGGWLDHGGCVTSQTRHESNPPVWRRRM